MSIFYFFYILPFLLHYHNCFYSFSFSWLFSLAITTIFSLLISHAVFYPLHVPSLHSSGSRARSSCIRSILLSNLWDDFHQDYFYSKTFPISYAVWYQVKRIGKRYHSLPDHTYKGCVVYATSGLAMIWFDTRMKLQDGQWLLAMATRAIPTGLIRCEKRICGCNNRYFLTWTGITESRPRSVSFVCRVEWSTDFVKESIRSAYRFKAHVISHCGLVTIRIDCPFIANASSIHTTIPIKSAIPFSVKSSLPWQVEVEDMLDPVPLWWDLGAKELDIEGLDDWRLEN